MLISKRWIGLPGLHRTSLDSLVYNALTRGDNDEDDEVEYDENSKCIVIPMETPSSNRQRHADTVRRVELKMMEINK